MLERRNTPRPPSVRFRAEGHKELHSNVNFAHTNAQDMANEHNKEVPVWQVVDGKNSMVLTTMKPKSPVRVNPREKAYKEGAIAASGGKVVGDNPYPPRDETHWDWMNGFVTIKEEEIKSKQ